MKATIIYNPRAGGADLRQMLEQLIEKWEANGWSVLLWKTERAGHATELAHRAVAEQQQIVWVAGGDGTFGEVATGLAGTDLIFAPLPAGTGNSFTKELRLPRPHPFMRNQFLKAADLLEQGVVQKMDLGYCNGRYWLLWAGIGADGFVISKMEPRSKSVKRLGAVGYICQALYFLPQFPGISTRITIDDQLFEGDYYQILISNSRLFGGGEIRLSPEAKLDDGLFEIWLLEGKTKGKMLKDMIGMRLERHHQNETIKMILGRKIEIETTPLIPLHTDGDPKGTTPFSCEIKPKALHVLIPPTAPKGLFQEVGIPLRNFYTQ